MVCDALSAGIDADRNDDAAETGWFMAKMGIAASPRSRSRGFVSIRVEPRIDRAKPLGLRRAHVTTIWSTSRYPDRAVEPTENGEP